MKVLVSAGEVSGDVAGALLARALLRLDPGVTFYGLGGPRMAAEGVDLLRDTNPLGTVGVSEAFRVIPSLTRAFRALSARVRTDPPDVAVLIANDIFNVVLGRWLRRHGVRTMAWFPPQVWIWRSLARPFSRSYDAVLACFPDEIGVWERAGVPTQFVGHYLADALVPVEAGARREARDRLGLPQDAPVVAVLPGSRTYEVGRLAPALLRAASIVAAVRPSVAWVLPVAEPFLAREVERHVEEAGLAGRVVFAPPGPASLACADLALTVSGTASLEAALLGVPSVVVYRASLLTGSVVRSAIALSLMDSTTVALPNLVLGKTVVPELIQRRVRPERIAAEALKLLDDPVLRETVRSELLEVGRLLRVGGSADRTADAVLSLARAPSDERVPDPEGALATSPDGRS